MPNVYNPPRRRKSRKMNRRPGQPLRVLWQMLPKLLALALLVELTTVAFTSPLLKVRRVKVVGVSTVTPAEVIAVAKVPVGKNLFRVNLRRIAAGAATHPVIDSASASFLPPGTVVIRVRERQPVFVLVQGSDLWEVDAKNIPFRRVSKALPGVPQLTIADIHEVNPGKRLKSESLASALDCLRLVGNPIAREVSKISVDLKKNMCLNVSDGIEVRLGQPEKLPDKLAYLNRVRTEAPQDYENAEYIDLSCLEAPAMPLR